MSGNYTKKREKEKYNGVVSNVEVKVKVKVHLQFLRSE